MEFGLRLISHLNSPRQAVQTETKKFLVNIMRLTKLDCFVSNTKHSTSLFLIDNFCSLVALPNDTAPRNIFVCDSVSYFEKVRASRRLKQRPAARNAMNTNNLRRKTRRAMMLAGAAALAMGVSGCIIGSGNGPLAGTGPVQTESISVPAGRAKSVTVHLKMAAGQLEISSGADKLLTGKISYNVADWKPDLSYNVDGSHGTLMIMQPEAHHTNLGNIKYDWDLRFSNKTPLDVSVEMGAGQSDLSLAGLQLENLDMEAGAGNATVDMSGPWKKNLTATFQAGVGSLHLKLPREAGVRVTIDGGLGSVDAPDFQKDGDAYVNAAYGKSPVTLEIHIEGGIGSVNLELTGTAGPV